MSEKEMLEKKEFICEQPAYRVPRKITRYVLNKQGYSYIRVMLISSINTAKGKEK